MTFPLRRRTRGWLALLLLLPVLIAACAKTGTGAYDDATVTARVKTILLNDRELSLRPVDVTTFDGVVTLSGSVKTEAERERVVELTKTARGVRDVRSNLGIKP